MRGKMDTPSTRLHDHSFSWLGPGTSINHFRIFKTRKGKSRRFYVLHNIDKEYISLGSYDIQECVVPIMISLT